MNRVKKNSSQWLVVSNQFRYSIVTNITSNLKVFRIKLGINGIITLSHYHIITLFFLLFFTEKNIAQPFTQTKVNFNPVIDNYIKIKKINSPYNGNVSYQRGVGDTLLLPFWDDFSYDGPFPDGKLWADNYVYVNNHFATFPPSIGYATFDNLNWDGQPFHPINPGYYGGSDTLTSKPININIKKNGPSDSLYISFFLEPQGLDPDPLNNVTTPSLPQDSMHLQFLNDTGGWINIWSISGQGLKNQFTQYMFGIKDSMFFHGGFRFRFFNTSRQTGNANHWHIDYVYAAKKRTKADTNYFDFPLTMRGNNLLKNYNSMSWKQFKPNAANEMLDTVKIFMSNLDISAQIISTFRHIYKDANYAGLDSSNNTIPNFPGKSFYELKMKAWNFSNLSPVNDTLIINRRWYETVPVDIHRRNDTLHQQQIFANYLAYDDGTAEGGYGIANIQPNKTEKAAQKFTLNVDDTLWGIGFYYNQSYSNVHGKNFKICIWKSIDLHTINDVLYKSFDVDSVEYKIGQNYFVYYTLDTPIVIPAGTFYIGWSQNLNFMLNVGQDRNFAYDRNFAVNPNIYFTSAGTWHQHIQTDNVSGALMIRPYLGHAATFSTLVGVENSEKFRNKENKTYSEIKLFPNPSNDKIFLETKFNFKAKMDIFSSDGKQIYSGNYTSYFSVSEYAEGIYFLRITSEDGLHSSSSKFEVSR